MITIYIWKKISKFVKERRRRMKQFNLPIKQIWMIQDFIKRNTSAKRFNDFDNAIKRFEKIEDGDLKLEEMKNEQNHILTKWRRKV